MTPVPEWDTIGISMVVGRGTMKEVKVRLENKEHKRLSIAAQKALRSINKQVTIYILKGLEADQQNQSA